VGAAFFGNQVLLGKDYPIGDLYLFIPAGTVVSQGFLSKNNLFSDVALNDDKTQKGYFTNSCRVKAVRFRGNTSTGVLLKLDSLKKLGIDTTKLAEGQEFNEIHGVKICEKYIVPTKGSANTPKSEKTIDKIVSSKQAPEHHKSLHLLKFIHDLDIKRFALTVKLHGCSGRTFNTLTRRQLTWKDKLAKWCGIQVQEEEYNYVVGSRHVIKSVGFKATSFKQHFYKADLWTQSAEEFLKGKLHPGEGVYYELIGKLYDNGGPIQGGYTYGFLKPELYVYRITHITKDGTEIDLAWPQVKARCQEMGLHHCPEIFYGTLDEFFLKNGLSPDKGKEKEVLAEYLQSLLDKPSILDNSVVEEGYVMRLERYPTPHHYKIKAPKFLLHETKLQDEGISDPEEELATDFIQK